MTELSKELKSLIAFGMEDQENSFYLDLGSMTLVKNPETVLPESMEKIPEWKPADGFRLMEEFVSSIKSEEIKNELSLVLTEGKGVFKNFKITIKKHPVIEKNWLRFKESKFDNLIEDWFKLLVESKNLEIFFKEEDQDKETDNLINSDFDFLDLSFEELPKLENEYNKKIQGSATDLILDTLNKKHRELYSKGILAIKAVSLEGITAGFVTAHQTCLNSKIAVISGLKVFPEYRGMGIGEKLLNDSIKKLQLTEFSEILIWETNIPDFFEEALLKTGFIKTGSIFRLNMLV